MSLCGIEWGAGAPGVSSMRCNAVIPSAAPGNGKAIEQPSTSVPLRGVTPAIR